MLKASLYKIGNSRGVKDPQSQLVVKKENSLNCDHSNESDWVLLSCGTVYYAFQVEQHLIYFAEIIPFSCSLF